MGPEQKHPIQAQDIESGQLNQTNKKIFQRLTDLVDDLKAVEEYEKTIEADGNPGPQALTRPASTAS
jgi:hypothetical protein